MLVVGYNDPSLDAYDVGYHIGDVRLHDVINGNDIFVRADGPELEAIRKQFTGLPMHGSEFVTWRGELARFIIDNIDL